MFGIKNKSEYDAFVKNLFEYDKADIIYLIQDFIDPRGMVVTDLEISLEKKP